MIYYYYTRFFCFRKQNEWESIKKYNFFNIRFDFSWKVCYNKRMKEMKQEGELHKGHRKRMIERLKKGGLVDHEYLECLLFYAIPRRNTNDIAHRLLAKFGSLPKVLSASYAELIRVDGLGESAAAYLTYLGAVFQKYYREDKNQYTGEFDARKFALYVNELYADEKSEVADVYLLNEHNEILRRKRFTLDHIGHVTFEPIKLAELVMEYCPSGIVLVHNHLLGSAAPSDTDEEMTRKCQILCSMHNIMFCDHVIYAKDGVYSYYLSGRMQEIGAEYSLDSIMKARGGDLNE